jgi:hypothetical protein
VLLDAGAGTEAERALARPVAAQDEDGGWSGVPIMRIPLPGDRDLDRPRADARPGSSSPTSTARSPRLYAWRRLARAAIH